MKKKSSSSAFTLVELIVVITILAILGTIAFISLSGYSRNARNSNRISDIKLIEKALSIYITSNSQYPNPDNATSITYSGALAWKQGIFGTGALTTLRTISNVPKDPQLGVAYNYSVLNGNTTYELATAIEGGLLATNNPLLSQSHALSAPNYKSYNVGTYTTRDVKVATSSGCIFITAPSIILSDIPVLGELVNDDLYSFSFQNSPNIPPSYSNIDGIQASTSVFQMKETLNSCTISDISELELYIAQLGTTYQSLAPYDQYEDLVFNFNTLDFQRNTAIDLQNRGIIFSDALTRSLNNPDPTLTFNDTFTDADTPLTGHTPDSSGSWGAISGSIGEYEISSNTLRKNTTSVSSIISSTPTPIISNKNYSVSFDIENFGGGGMSVYLRYSDANNHYRLDIAPTGYQISRRTGGSGSTLQTITETINTGDAIEFSVAEDVLKLSIDGILKENIIAGGVDSIGQPGIFLLSSNASIDNYTLTYK